jgi:hypothetical protein
MSTPSGTSRRSRLGGIVLTIIVVAGTLVVGSGAVIGTAGVAGAATGKIVNGKCTGDLEVGIGYMADRAAAYSSFGLGSEAALVPSNAATQNEYNAYVSYVNSHGGLDGCQVQAVYHGFKYTDPDITAEEQSECVAFTQDTKVFVALTFWGASTCIANTKTPQLAAPGEFGPVSQESPEYYLYPELPPVAPVPYGASVKAMSKAGFFKKGATIGFVYTPATYQPDPTVSALKTSIDPALKSLGLKFADVQTISAGNGSGAALTTEAQACTQAAIKFKAAGVNELILPDTALVLQCASAWEAQSFSPRVGALISGPAVDGTGSEAAITPDVAPGLAGDFWMVSQSVWDLGGGIVGTFASWPKANQAKEQQCAKIAGPNLASTAEGPDVVVCETLLWLQAAMKHALSATPAGLEKGIEALGTYTGFADLWGPAQFGPGETYGVHYVQVLKYNPTQHIFVKVGPLASI